MIRRLAALALALALPVPSLAVAQDPPLVAFLGDSLSAGYGLAASQAFPAVLERTLRERGTEVRVLNAGVSGDTTAGGLSRLPWILGQEPDVVVVELGANDALRGQPLEAIERNLRAIVERAREGGAVVVLLEMAIPTSYGPDYGRGFTALYGRVARDLDVALVEEFLHGVGGVAALNQPDGIHPTAEGHERLAASLVPAIESAVGAQR